MFSNNKLRNHPEVVEVKENTDSRGKSSIQGTDCSNLLSISTGHTYNYLHCTHPSEHDAVSCVPFLPISCSRSTFHGSLLTHIFLSIIFLIADCTIWPRDNGLNIFTNSGTFTFVNEHFRKKNEMTSSQLQGHVDEP